MNQITWTFCKLLICFIITFILWKLGKNFIFYLCLIILVIIFLDFIFKILYFRKYGKSYVIQETISLEDFMITDHPYLPFVLKEQFKKSKLMRANYPLSSKNEYFFPKIGTNNIGVINGPDGCKNVEMKTSKIRVVCLGASTTGNYIQEGDNVYSYPNLLEENLNIEKPGAYEVINAGIGGYNSADILIFYLLRIQDLKPDIVILYHGYNDIRHYLSNGFKSDYSHSMVNFAAKKSVYKINKYFPSIKISWINFLMNKLPFINVRNSLLKQIYSGRFDINLDPTIGLETYRRNITNLVQSIKNSGSRVILSSFCHYSHSSISKSQSNKTYDKIVKRENKITYNISKSENCEYLDVSSMILKNNHYFVDSIHFSPEGMKLLAKALSTKILGKGDTKLE